MVKRKLFTSREELERLYIQENKSTHEIGRFLGVDSKTLWYWLKKYGLSIRSRSEAIKGERNYMYGKHHSEEHNKRVSKKLKGCTPSEETRRLLSKIAKNQWCNHATRERILSAINSPEYRSKMSQIVTERSRNPEWVNKLSESQKNRWDNDPEGKQNLSKMGKVRWALPEFRRKSIASMIRAQNMPETKKRTSELAKQRWQNKDYKSRVLSKTLSKLCKRPTRPELKLIELSTNNGLPLKYVGDGSFLINGLNPDFIVPEKNKIVEVFGRTFHDPEKTYLKHIKWTSQYWGRTAFYSQLGYQCLILWDDELKDEEHIVERIRRFVS